VLETFHPIVRRWFGERFAAPTEPQARAWPAIAAGEDVLVSAPTGSGKTLAAFLSALDGLLREALAGSLPDATRVVYVSPLRALSNDVERNLLGPLAGLSAEAAAAGFPAPELRVALRTGDTTGARRQAILRRPPHVLVTTPESLYLLLTAERGRALLASVETVIVDEIHALARDKRGAHLALSLERLEALARRRPQRIGLSATVEPLDEVARFLVGAGRVNPAGRPHCRCIEVNRLRRLDLGLEIPDVPLSSVASNEQWAGTYDRVAELIRARRSTIVFVNTRRLAERAAHALAQRLGEDAVAAHHGSLSRERRLDAEERLKAGRLRAIVATASLELGIDVGAVELVVQLGSPGSLGAALQRVGRAGHVLGATPCGRFFPMTRDELVECAALVRGLRQGRLEPTRAPEAPLDVLAQQVAAEAASRTVGLDELFGVVRRAWPYRGLSRERFDAVVTMLSDGIAPRAGRATALLHRDDVHGQVRGRRGTRYAALTGAGAIPDNAQYAVVVEPEGTMVGQVDEDFAVESMAGDVFLLGNASWRVRRVEPTAVRVEDARGQPPSVPFWNGEAPGRSRALSDEVSALRQDLEALLDEPDAAVRWLAAECALAEPAARQLVEYLAAGRAALGALPTRRTFVAERFFDEGGGMQLVVHAPLGARTNRALGLALRKRFCRTFDFELQAAATDEGVLLSLGPQHSFPLETIFGFVTEGTVEEVLRQAVLQAPMFGVRWRWAATRALAIPRLWKGKRIPPPLSRMRADDLLAAVFPAQVACQDNAPPGPIEVPDHPLVEEALRDCLTEAMDTPALREVLGEVARGEVRLLAVDTREPSPLAHEILGGKPWSYLDDAPLEERRARMVSIRRALPEDAASLARLDPASILEVSEEVWPDVRDQDELHDALLELGLLPEGAAEGAGWAPLLEALAGAGRASRLRTAGRAFWIAAERVRLALAAPVAGEGARFLDPPCEPLRSEAIPSGPDEAAVRVVRGWVARIGPFTARSLAERIGLDAEAVAQALLVLEADGLVLRGRFLDGAPWSAEAPHFCERTVLARIHRLTLGRLRKEIEPVTTADLLRFLLRWQHLAPGTRLHGARGLAEVIGQLQGYHAAAGAWERGLLAARIGDYQPALLDSLCLSGEVAWGRLSLRPERAEAEAAPRARAPTRAAPVTLALREDLEWLLATARAAPEAPADPAPQGDGSPADPLPAAAREVLAVLRARGASFPVELAAATRRSLRDVEEGLWTLVACGLATCDGFAGLRSLVERGAGRKGASGGRWSLLHAGGGAPAPGGDLLERLGQQYLRRYGVVFRELLAREDAPPWRELVRVYRRLEARGSVRGGRFVEGRSGEQFALPEAVDALRAVRRIARQGAERVEVPAADPLNLVGILTPGARVPAQLGGTVVYVDGVPADTYPAGRVPAPSSATSGTRTGPVPKRSSSRRAIAAESSAQRAAGTDSWIASSGGVLRSSERQ
jgi:ATP-dependent Lhr-like helicase